jgi:hypothetical protein
MEPKQAVSIDAPLSLTEEVTLTGIENPVYARCPRRAVDLPAPEQWPELLGCDVVVRGALVTPVPSIERFFRDPSGLTDPFRELRSRSLLAQPESHDDLWLVSDHYLHNRSRAAPSAFVRLRDADPGDLGPSGAQWMAQGEYVGRLSLLQDLSRNLHVTSGEWAKLRSSPMISENENAYAILTARPNDRSKARAATRSSRLVPLLGSHGTLLVNMGPDQAPPIGTMHGFLQLASAAEQESLRKYFPTGPFVILTVRPGYEHEVRLDPTPILTVILGAGLVALGAGLIIAPMLRRKSLPAG